MFYVKYRFHFEMVYEISEIKVNKKKEHEKHAPF